MTVSSLISRNGAGVWLLLGLLSVALLADAPGAAARAQTRIVYMDGDQVRSVRPDGRGDRRLVRLPGLVDISAADNGSRIAAVSVTERTTAVGDRVEVAGVYSMRGDGSGITVIREVVDEDLRSVGLSADGRRLRYDTGDPANFALGRRGYLAWDGTYNGDRDVVVGLDPDCRYKTSQVIASEAEETDPTITWDGYSLAYSSDDEGGQLWSWRNIFTRPCRFETGKPKLIAKTGAGTMADPDFSPNGASIVYVARRQGRLRLMTIRMDGSNRALVGPGISGRAPQWTRLP